jgi:hypothetical protein
MFEATEPIARLAGAVPDIAQVFTSNAIQVGRP